MLLTSCETCKPDPIVITETVNPPAVTFPEFPSIDGVEYSEDFTTVYVPANVWIALAQYGLDVKKTEDQYKAFRSEN